MSFELDRVRGTWEHLGRMDPYWAVLTENPARDAESRASFFESGRAEVRYLLDILDRHGRDYGDIAVDFGCGVGRLSYALGEHFSTVHGVDVAASMLAEAEANNPRKDRITFVHNDSSDLPFPDDYADLVLSLIVLQHIPPRLSLRYLLEMIRVTKQGGHLIFQIPSHLPVSKPFPPESCRAGIEILDAPDTLVANEFAYVRVSVSNDSHIAWPGGQLVNLGNHWYRDGQLVQLDDGRERVRPALRPGEATEITLRVTAPEQPGRYELELDVVQESVAWFAQLGSKPVRHGVEVRPHVEAVAVTAPAAPSAAPSAVAATEAPAAVETVEAPAQAPPVKNMEMHGVRRELICGLFEQLGCKVLEVIPDGRAGDDWTSFLYVIEVGRYEVDRDSQGE